MLTITIIDHLFVILFALVYPIVGYINYRKILKLYRQGEAPSRKSMYLSTIFMQWVIFAVGTAMWLGLDRPLAPLGIHFEEQGSMMIGLGLFALITAGLLWQWRSVHQMEEDRLEEFRSQLEILRPVLPHTPADVRMFYPVSITAGIVEEVLWRGFLIWYLGQYMPLWAAASISAIVFGLAHAYQGKEFIPKVIGIGAMMTVLYLVSGSIWVPILMHAVFDIIQGHTTYGLLKPSRSVDPQTS